MTQKSTTPLSSQSGLSAFETVIGVCIVALLLSVTVFYAYQVQHQIKFDRTMNALYVLQNEVRKASRAQGSYAQKGLMPILFALRAFPKDLKIDEEERIVITPTGYLLDIVGRGRYFSLDLYSLSPNDCFELGEQMIKGDYFYLGAQGDDFMMMKIGETVFDDSTPPTAETLEKACTNAKYVDVFLGFR